MVGGTRFLVSFGGCSARYVKVVPSSFVKKIEAFLQGLFRMKMHQKSLKIHQKRPKKVLFWPENILLKHFLFYI
jgi:hypothetical protein